MYKRQADGLRQYVHIGTGNYNPVTARIYTDLGYMTSNPEVTTDVANLFNAITGYSRKEEYRALLVAPSSMRGQILAKIEREIESHRDTGDGHLAFKMNSLVDKACIKALYQASMAGVRVDLQVRGICCLRPGVEGVSENITVTSIVGRFLEHSRIYYFRNGGEEEILIGSADLMPRNLGGRVETLTPVENEQLKSALRDDILFLHLRDNVKSRRLGENGDYQRLAPGPDELPINSQEILLERPGSWHLEE